jgi:hypothetical protein
MPRFLMVDTVAVHTTLSLDPRSPEFNQVMLTPAGQSYIAATKLLDSYPTSDLAADRYMRAGERLLDREMLEVAKHIQ